MDAPKPRLAYFGSAVVDSSSFERIVYTIALAEFATIIALLSLQTAREGVTWPTGSNNLTFLAHAMYPVGRIFCISKHLAWIVREKLGVENQVRDTPYAVEEVTVILDAAENQP